MAKLEVGTAVDVYDASGPGGPLVYQGPATIAGYARNNCYVVREEKHRTTWHRHFSLVIPTGQLMPSSWKPTSRW